MAHGRRRVRPRETSARPHTTLGCGASLTFDLQGAAQHRHHRRLLDDLRFADDELRVPRRQLLHQVAHVVRDRLRQLKPGRELASGRHAATRRP
ncbi:Uncharacterised protein [Amycolatopsis camponoti]|uniref:Uncharacterized protein n=1 Tax=Amycolatopsis camponoti TaxID=2606593 RepID=A0A6I8M537_9PSEU|nr:Uncharacterised protein [Amycolatopsis camponoti]